MNTVIFKESVVRSLRDFSFFILTVIITGINLFLYLTYHFQSFGIDRFLLWLTFMFDILVVMAYSGYLSSKLFIREIERKSMEILFLTQSGKIGTYMQKTLAGYFLIFTISFIAFFQPIVTMFNFGTVPLLFIYWSSIYFLISLISGIFVFSLSNAVGFALKKSIYSMLGVSFYIIISFFTLALIPLQWNNDFDIMAWITVFPFMASRFAFLATEAYGTVPPNILILAVLGIVWIVIIENTLWEVKV